MTKLVCLPSYAHYLQLSPTVSYCLLLSLTFLNYFFRKFVLLYTHTHAPIYIYILHTVDFMCAHAESWVMSSGGAVKNPYFSNTTDIQRASITGVSQNGAYWTGTHPPTHSLTHYTHSLTHSPTHSPTHLLTHPPTYSSTHLFTHPPTPSLTLYPLYFSNSLTYS